MLQTATDRPRERKGLTLSIATTNDEGGTIEGYLAVFGNVDSTGEIIRKGAFARSISEAVPAGRIPLMARHFRDGGDALECVGTVIAAREDDFGLWVRARFSSDPAAQTLRTRVNEGHITGLSAGFYPLRWQTRAPVTRAEERAVQSQDRAQIVEWLEARLVEGTLTVRPANDLARISLSPRERADVSGPFRERGVRGDAHTSTSASHLISAQFPSPRA